jgi:uncharacterized protein YjdB
MALGQAVQTATIADGTVINFIVADGRLYRIGTDLTSKEDVTPGGVTIDATTRVYLTPFSNRIAVNDGVNTPWIASDLLSSPVTATRINYESDGSDWVAYGPLVVWKASLFAIVRKRNGEGDAAGTPEKRLVRVGWSEVDDPFEGWHQTDFDNEWDITQNGDTAINALIGTNNDLLYFREGSIGYLNGSLDDLRTTATHDAIDENIGVRAPATMQQFGQLVFFADKDGRVMVIRKGAVQELWLQMRRLVTVAKTRFPDVTARTACSAIVPELDLYICALWSPDPTNEDGLVFPTEMYVFRATDGVYNGRWTIGPRNGDKVAIHAMGVLVGPNGEERFTVLGKPSLAEATDPLGVYILDLLDDEQWHDDDEVPALLIKSNRIAESANAVTNGNQAVVIVDTVPDPSPTEDDEDTVKTVTIAPTSFQLAQGGTRQLSAVVRNPSGTVLTGKTVSWRSDNPAVASVSVTGVVTGGATGGVAHITAIVDGIQSNSATVQNTATVADNVPASIAVTPTTLSLANLETAQLTAVVKNAAGKVLVGVAVTWTSPDTTIAAVSPTGVVTGGVTPGTITITATAGTVSTTVSVTSAGAVVSQVVATVGISPTSKSLPVGQQQQLTAVARDLNGVVMTGITFSWASTNSAIATVSSTGLVTAIAEGVAVIRAASPNGVISPDSTMTVTAAVTVVGDFAIIEDVLGPSIDEADMPGDFPSFWLDHWKFYMDQSWDLWGAQWDAGNSISGYDRAAICYMLYKITKDPKWLSRGHQYAVNYRDNYLVPAGYATSPHWSQMEGIYLHWKLTGDADSLTAVLSVAYKLSGFPTTGYFQVPQGEGRIEARVLLALWLAEKAGSTDWTTLLTLAVQTVLSTMNADGFTPFDSTCGGSLNYMNGMLWDVLGRLRQKRPNAAYNADIDAKMPAFGNYLWNTQIHLTDSGKTAFNYISLVCPSTGSPTSAPDLNGLIVPVFGYLGKYMDAAWFTKGDLVLAGMADAFLSQDQAYRQLSENYTSSYRYAGYKYS